MTAASQLQDIRRDEFERVRRWFRPGTRVLELGGGNGYQASLIAATGADVVSIDIADRERTGAVFWNVHEYDGIHIDAPDASFDVVFSSNVLEHIRTLDLTLSEIRRVLRPGGLAIHVLPSATWRLWMILAEPFAVTREILRRRTLRARTSGGSSAGPPARLTVGRALRLIFVAAPHGEYPSALSELWYFSRFRWNAYFKAHGWEVRESFGNGLAYTGWAFFPGLPFALRRVGARLLGSSARTFVVTPVRASASVQPHTSSD